MIRGFDLWTACSGCNKIISKEPWESPIQLCEECLFKEHTKCNLCGGESEQLESKDGFRCKKCKDVYYIPNLLEFNEGSQVHYSQIFGDDEWLSRAQTSMSSLNEARECTQSAA